MEVKQFNAGSVIFEEGETGKTMYVLQSGSVELRKKTQDAERLLKTVNQKNEVFGEMALIDDLPRSARAVALTEVRAFEINEAAFEHLVQTNGAFAWKVIQILSERIRNSNRHISELSEGDSRERYIRAIVDYAQREGEKIFSGGLKVEVENMHEWLNSRMGIGLKEAESHLFRLLKSNTIAYAPTSAKTHDAIVLSPDFIRANERRAFASGTTGQETEEA